MGKTTGNILGIALILIGIILGIYGITNFFGVAQNIGDIQNNFARAGTGIITIFIGGVLVIAGGVITYLTNIGKLFSYVAKEVSPGTEKITHAIGKGVSSGVKKGWKK